MRELWRVNAELKRIRQEARTFLSLGEEGEVEALGLMNRLRKMGVIHDESKLNELLGLSVRDLLERRLQTQVFKKGLAMTPKQARQLITHGFISMDGRRITKPSYLVLKKDEDNIKYCKDIDIK